MKKMTKTKMAALAAIVAWPIAYALGFRGGMWNIAAGAAVFLWIFQVISDVPETDKKKRNLGHRPF